MQRTEKHRQQILGNKSTTVSCISTSKHTFTTKHYYKFLFGFALQVTRGQNIKVSCCRIRMKRTTAVCCKINAAKPTPTLPLKQLQCHKQCHQQQGQAAWQTHHRCCQLKTLWPTLDQGRPTWNSWPPFRSTRKNQNGLCNMLSTDCILYHFHKTSACSEEVLC